VTRAALATLALAFTVAHLPHVVSSLDDIDSVNFALGLRDFDVAKHQPHPPGYPAYIALGKLARSIVRSFDRSSSASTIEARALSLLSLVAGVIAIALLYRLLTCCAPVERGGSLIRADSPDPPWRAFDPRAVAATAMAVACPLFWYLAVRPMSDLPGLTAALAAQAALALAWWRQRPDAGGDRRLAPHRMTASGRMIVLGSLLAGIAIGFRAQNALLTLPLLLGVLVDRIGRGVAGALIGSAVALTTGAAMWAIPLVVASGGIGAYLAALGSQAGEDFAGVEMLYAHPSARLAAFAALHTFVYPWDSIVLGGIVVGLALVGLAAVLVRDRRSFAAVGLLSVPYLVFHLLLQDTTFVRYALPLVPTIAFLSVCGLEVVLRRAALVATAVLTLWAVAIATPVLAAYASEPSPTTRALAAMHSARDPSTPGALAMHQTFRRPLEAENVAIQPWLPSPPRREWFEVVRYWREQGSAPLWFLADPRRTDLALVDPKSRADRADFGWRFTALSDLGGLRPGGLTWYRMPAPGWFAEEGWALTPEIAGISRLMGRGPAIGPITAWVRRRDEPLRMLIGGRHLGSAHDPRVRFDVLIDGRSVAHWESTAGFFLHQFDLAPTDVQGTGTLARLTVGSTTLGEGQVSTAIEQFDLQSRGSLMWGYDTGWHEAEYDPQRGMWRWASDRSTLRIIDARSPIAITFRVERPSRYFEDDPTVRLLCDDRVIAETNFRDSELWSVIVPLDALQHSEGRVTLETNRTFVPAERGEAPDLRRLGLRVFGVNVAPQP
jgi:hypothetical protein